MHYLMRPFRGKVAIEQQNQMIITVQGDSVGFKTGNGEKLTYSQAAGLAMFGCVAVEL